ncbi:MAG: WecB/TagA/CpsF family glycosyltransferase [Pseudomonadota bacterium]
MSGPFSLAIGGTRIAISVADRASLDKAISHRFARGDGFALATLNLDHLVKLKTSPAFARAYATQDLVVADGNPIVWLSYMAGRPVDLMPGSDLVEPLTRMAAAQDMPVALLGATEPVLRMAGETLTGRIPRLRIVAHLAPSQNFDPEGEEAAAMLAELGRSGARICFLALGAPRQEMFAARGRRELPGVGFVSIGAGLDFLAGSQQRAPRWVRRIAMEWLWRMALNPARLTVRYLRCIAILPGLIMSALAERRAR